MECVEFKQPQTLPVFFGAGEFDDLVLPQWSHQSFQYLKTKGYGELILRDYDMEHAICSEELVDLSSWLNERIEIHIQKLEGL
jgi:phospholipase/carboxylesterase